MTLLALPRALFAQAPGKVWRVGWLINIGRPDSDARFTNAFPRGMRELGYVEGKNLVIKRRYSDGIAQNLPGTAAELVQMSVDVLVSGSSLPTAAAQKATSTIPIVFLADGDPVGNGFVASLARPGGNITGQSTFATELNPKLLELLGAMVHKLPTIAALTEFTTAGGLISFGPSLNDMFRRGATCVDKILKGAKPGDLPVEQPTKFELIINLKTAKALGLTVPQALLVRADEVIP